MMNENEVTEPCILSVEYFYTFYLLSCQKERIEIKSLIKSK